MRIRKKGFTLVELLVVISIIALLLSILMPSLARTRAMAKAVVCQSNLGQWGVIFFMRTNDNNDRFMKGYIPEDRGGSSLWMNDLRPYYSDSGKFRTCPMASKVGDDMGGGTFMAWGKFRGFWGWDKKGDYGSYGMNSWLTDHPNQSISDRFWRTANVKGAASIPMLLDSCWVEAYPMTQDAPPLTEDMYWSQRSYMGRFCVNRHNEAINAVFLDAAVRKVGLKELWKLKWHRNYKAVIPDWSREAPWMSNFKDY